MREETHREKVERLRLSIASLDPAKHWDLVVEAAFGISLNLLALIAESRQTTHHDPHKGMYRYLLDSGLTDEARLFLEMNELRMGAWYGNRGNQRSAARALELVAELERRLAGGAP